ncbi:hypothetical protein FA95DRAFT_1478806, partial [Auriscalpium vulgare]
LPAEIMICIFIFLQHRHWRLPPWTTQESPSWIVVTHVCGHWRRIALNSHVLWNNVSNIYGMTWLEEMITRAAAAPLSV